MTFAFQRETTCRNNNKKTPIKQKTIIHIDMACHQKYRPTDWWPASPLSAEEELVIRGSKVSPRLYMILYRRHKKLIGGAQSWFNIMNFHSGLSSKFGTGDWWLYVGFSTIMLVDKELSDGTDYYSRHW